MKLLSNPIVVIVLAVLFSTVPVLGMIWKESAAIVSAAVSQKAAAVEATRPEKPWDFWTPEVENLAKELTEQRGTLARREAELATREKRMSDEKSELDETRRKIESLRTEIASRLVEVQAQELRNLKTLANTYSKLSPSAAVAIFGEMDDLTVAKLLSLMKPETTTAILEEFSRNAGSDKTGVKRAAELSQRLRLLMPVQQPAK
jgi:flagellar motility protein MotE (MotC chaperone)